MSALSRRGTNTQIILSSFIGLVMLVVLVYSVLNLHWAVPLGIICVVCGSVLMFVRPEIALLGIISVRIILDLFWWAPVSIGGVNLLAAFTGGATVLCAALCILEFRKLERHPGLTAFLLFGLVLILSGFRTLDAVSGVELMTRFVSPLLMMFVVTTFLPNERDTRRLLKLLVVITCIPLCVSIYHLVTGQMHSHTLAGYDRLLGGYKNLRHHAMMMMLMASVGGFWLLQARSLHTKTFMLGYIACATVCMYLTYIRTGVLALSAFVVCFLYISQRYRELTICVALGVLFAILSPEIHDRFKDLALIFSMGDDMFVNVRKLGSGRLGLWADSFREYLHQPLGDILLGLGMGKHWVLTRSAYNPFSLVQSGQVDTHSDYLGVLYQIGPIALGCYLFMQARVFVDGYRLSRSEGNSFSKDLGSLAAALSVAVFVTNTISNGFVNRTTLGWVFWGVAGAMYATRDRVKTTHQAALQATIPLNSKPTSVNNA